MRIAKYIIHTSVLTITWLYGTMAIAQQNDTKNITPFNTRTVKHERLAVTPSGDVYLQTAVQFDGVKDPFLMILKKTGDYWRNITPPSNKEMWDLRDIIPTKDSTVYLLSNVHGTFGSKTVLNGYPPGGWYDLETYKIGTTTAIAVDNNNELVLAGNYTQMPTAPTYYLARRHKDKWEMIGPKNIPADLKPIFDTYTIGKILIDQKNYIYAYLFNTKENKYQMLMCNGKDWKTMGSVLNGAVFDMVLDKENNLYVAGNFKDDNNDYYITKWNGKQWSNIPAPPETKFKADINRTLAIGNNNQLLTGGRHKKGKENVILSWNGTDWEQYGTVPGAVGEMAYGNGNIYATVEGIDAGVYLVPENGKLTASSTEAPGQKPDLKPKETLDFYYQFVQEFPAVIAKLPGLYSEWQNQASRTSSVEKSKDIQSESQNILSYIYKFQHKMVGLGLKADDNQFYDAFERAVFSQRYDYENLQQMMKDYQNQFMDKAQFDKWWKRYNDDQEKTALLFKKLPQDIPLYKKKNSL